MIGGLNQIESGYKLVILSIQLAEKLNSDEIVNILLYFFNVFFRHWKEHPRESLKPLQRSYQLSLETGFATWAGYSQMWIAIWAYVIGKNLPDLERLMSECREAVRIVKHQASFLNTGLFLQAVANLMGKNADPCQLTGDYFDETTTIQFHIQANENYGIHSVYLLKLKLCYLFYRYGEALLNADKAKPYEGNAMCTINIPLFNFYESLTNLAIADNNASNKKRALKIANRNQKKMKVWAHHAPMNHRHKYCLVEAERHRVLGKHEKAMGHYDTAISGAHENGYIQEEALANELAAKFYLNNGKTKIARTFLLEALNLYSQWGATAKVKHLADNFKGLLAESARGNKAAPGNEQYRVLSTSEGHETRLDIGSVIKASQVISGEIVFAKLVDRLLTIAMENAGARKGFLILESHGRQYIEAEGTIDPDRVIVQRSIPSEKDKVLSTAIINFVTRTKESVVLNNACHEGQFDKDPYVLETKAKSILCMPLIHRGKLTGMLYLENNLIEGAFTHDRLEVLRVLCAQAAISFESSRLYEQLEEHSRSLEQRVDERTAELKESLETLKRAQNQLVQSEKMAALGSLVAGVAHEVNTPVGVAITAASLLEERTDELVRLVSTGEIRRSDLDKFMKTAQESARMVLSNLRRAGEIIQSFKQVAVDQSSDEKRSFKLKSYIDDILLSLTPKLKRTFHTVKVQCPDDLELNSYPGAFYQIITNLVMNSLIHGFLEGDKGEILIEVTRDAEMYLFHYKDNGKGMDAKTLDKIFNPFFTTNRSKGGSGLGMHIVYNLAIQTLGGQIECISSPGNGIQIFIRFPV